MKYYSEAIQEINGQRNHLQQEVKYKGERKPIERDNIAQSMIKRYLNPHQTEVSEYLIRQGGGQMAHQSKSTIQAIFLHSKQQKPYQGTLRTQEPTPIGAETSLGPSMDPTGPLKQMVPDNIIFKIRVNKNQENAFFGHF